MQLDPDPSIERSRQVGQKSSPIADLLLPPANLASCVSAAIYRDTLGVQMRPEDRLNYFPATPLIAVSRIFEGQLHMARDLRAIDVLRSMPSLPNLSVTPPQDSPVCSWSPSGLRAITIAFYPDAWAALGGSSEGGAIPDVVGNALMVECVDISTYWAKVCSVLTPIWARTRQDQTGHAAWAGSNRVADWARHVTTRAALSGTGRSLRSAERRLRRWTGQSRQTIEFFAKVEHLHRRTIQNPDVPLAQIAVDSDFADQSHMGRAVKRATGFTPNQFNKRVENEEPFWCYRLLGERF